MKLNSPLPQPLSKECAKAAKIFKSFVDSGNNGLDGVIPRSVLTQAKGFAIFTIFKAGFIFSARGGSGVVIARLDDGSWSAPSAIGSAGLGIGTQAGAEVTDFLVVLNSKSAVRSFMAAGSLSFGGNMSVALGPLGRNGEASGALNTHGKLAAMYSYSKTRGLFGGISLEGTVIVEREDANALAYNSPVTAKMLLGGMVDPPEWAMPLIKTLEACTGMPGGRPWIDDDTRPSHSRTYSFGSGIGSDSISSQPSSSSRTPSFLRRKKQPQSEFPPAHWGVHSPGGSYSASEASRELSEAGNDYHSSSSARASFQTQFDSNFNPVPTFVSKARVHDDIIPPYNEDPLVASATLRGPQRSNSLYTPTSGRFTGRTTSSNLLDDSKDWEDERVEDPFGGPVSRSKSFSTNTHTYTAPKSELEPPLTDGVGRAIAMYRFDAKEPGDLSFDKGDVITIIKKSESTDDWWTGKLHGRQGIFPANFVELV